MLIGAVCLAGAFAMSYQTGAELLNFGALIGFTGVNVSSLTHYWVRGRERHWSHLILPLVGAFVCLYLWVSLSMLAKTAGACWLVFGLVYGAWKTGGFRKHLINFDAAKDE